MCLQLAVVPRNPPALAILFKNNLQQSMPVPACEKSREEKRIEEEWKIDQSDETVKKA
jgi:hypothetical protein